MMAGQPLRIIDENECQFHQDVQVEEPCGAARDLDVVEAKFEFPNGAAQSEGSFLVGTRRNGDWLEVPSQAYEVTSTKDGVTGRIAFLASDVAPNEKRSYRLFQSNRRPDDSARVAGMDVTSASPDPTHLFIDNDFYKIETMPKSGQIWHMWNKSGTNTSWHHNEWDANVNKGGDPCHWAPNCWVAYPERITNGYEVPTGGEDIDLIDWHYAFGWEAPNTEVIQGPLFTQIKRSAVIEPHPEHTNPKVRRPDGPLIQAEGTYRFYRDFPWFYQESTLETLADVRVFFIRNCQFVFLTKIFTHSFIAPETPDLRPHDEEDVAVCRLMGECGMKPYDYQQHSISNILPSKLAYYGFYHQENGDAFALFQLEESYTNIYSGTPTCQNHATLFSELPDWSAYNCRSFSYTNQRYNPENPTWLPKGERYHEKNIGLFFKHQDLDATLKSTRASNQKLQNPLRIAVRRA